jgi:hypothetical protein
VDTAALIAKNRLAGDYPFVSSRLLKRDDLKMIPPAELRLMRSEIYARYGYIFKTKDLSTHFERTSWYIPFYENVDHLLTDLEQSNIAFIKQHEKENKEISQNELFDFFIAKIELGERYLVPAAVAYKYGLTPFDEIVSVRVEKQVFKQADNYRFLVYNTYMGCNECPDQYDLRKFDLEGNQLATWELGNNLQMIEMRGDDHLYCYRLEYPITHNDEDTEEIRPEEVDTIHLHIKLTEKGDIYFE